MIPFLLGILLGFVAGLFVAALCAMAREADDRTTRIMRRELVSRRKQSPRVFSAEPTAWRPDRPSIVS